MTHRTTNSPPSRSLPISATFRFVVHPQTQWAAGDGCVVFDTPSFRGTSFGHRIQLDHPAADLDPWFALWQRRHGGKSIETAYLVWETNEPVPPPTGATVESLVGLRLRAGDVDEPAACLPIRRVTDAEWPALIASVIEANADADAGMHAYLRWFYDGYRARVRSSEGATWAAFDGTRPVAAASLFERGSTARFQDVWTLPSHRQRGLCTSLVRIVAGDLRSRDPDAEVLIMATSDGPADRIYRRVGFETRTHLVELSRPASELTS